MMTRNGLLSVAALLTAGLMFTACKDNNENPDTIVPVQTARYTASLNGQSEKPTSTTSTATGNFVGDLNQTTRVMSYTLTYTGLTPTGAHLHRIEKADGTGGITVPFNTTIANGYSGTVTLRQGQIDSLNNNQIYANVHSAKYPAGEIRGEVRKQ